MVKARFAPSPTGYLHVGGARTALFNWLFAKNKKGNFLLRIEDTDIKRSTQESVQAILDGLRYLGIDWDEGPYFQSERINIYNQFKEKLLKEKKAFYCYCLKEEIEAKRNQEAFKDERCFNLTEKQRKDLEATGRKPAVRLKNQGGKIKFFDLIRGEVEFDSSLFGDFIIIKSDDWPVYNFACVVDDVTMGITHVIRGDDHLSNTPKQILIYQALGFDLPYFAHLSMILGPDGTRLSKRHGATSLDYYRDKGYLPAALVNFLALLGWSTKDARQKMDVKEIISLFSLERVSKNPCIFDHDKLNWLNGEYIRELDLEDLTTMTLQILEANGYNDLRQRLPWLREVLKVYQPRLRYLAQLHENERYLFEDQTEFTPEAWDGILKKEGVIDILRQAKKVLEDCPFDLASVENAIRGLATEIGLKAAKVIHPLRAALTGKKDSPGIFDVIVLLGKDKVLQRLDFTIDRLKADSGKKGT